MLGLTVFFSIVSVATFFILKYKNFRKRTAIYSIASILWIAIIDGNLKFYCLISGFAINFMILLNFNSF